MEKYYENAIIQPKVYRVSSGSKIYARLSVRASAKINV